jgi:hypothetical protein
LCTGVNFINISRAAFTRIDPKSTKKTNNLTVFFVLFGSAFVKTSHKTLVKLTPAQSQKLAMLYYFLKERSMAQWHGTSLISGESHCIDSLQLRVAMVVLITQIGQQQ